MAEKDSTQLLNDKTAIYQLDASLAEQAEDCPHCAASIPAGEQFCGKCGYQRGTWGGSSDDELELSEPSANALFKLCGEGAEYFIPAGKSVIGRGDVDIKVADGYMSRSHAEFEAGEGSLQVTDLGSSNGTFVDGQQLAPQEPATVEPGQLLKIGQSEFTVYIVEAALQDTPRTPEAEHEATEDQAGDKADRDDDERQVDNGIPERRYSGWSLQYGGLEVQIAEGQTTFGRKAGKCDAVIEGDGFISGCHFELSADGGSLVLTDLGSTNGTFVGDERLEPDTSRAIEDGQGFRAGQTEFLISYEARGADSEQGTAAEPEAADSETPEEQTDKAEQ